MQVGEDACPADEASWRYRGWRVVAVLLLVEIAIFGFGLFGQGIYLAELRRLNDWPTGLIAAGSTLCLVLGSLLSMFASDLLRWMGPRRLVLAGIASLASGVGLLATAISVPQLYVGFVILSLGWVGLGMITAAAIVGAWFDRKLGLAISITFSGSTLGGVLLMPALVLLVDRNGFRAGLGIAAALAVIILVPLVASVVRFPRLQERQTARAALAMPSLTRAELLLDRGFWYLTLAFAFAILVQVAFIVHQVSILTPVIGLRSAGAVVSLTMAMSLTGRIALGVVADRIDPRRVTAASVVSQAVALGVLGLSSGTIELVVASAVFGFSMGNLITLPALIVQREFPPDAFGTVLGLSMAIAGVINACGPAAMGLLRDLTGSYATPTMIGIAIQIAAAAAVLFAPRSMCRLPQIGLPA
jgi:MFS family permease